MPGPAEILARQVVAKLFKTNDGQKNNAKSQKEQWSQNALDNYGSDKEFLAVWQTDVRNKLKSKEMVNQLIEQFKTRTDVALLPTWAEICIRTYNLSKALVISEVATIIDIDNSEAWKIRGMGYAMKHKNKQAEQCFQKALDCDPTNTNLQNYLYHIRKSKNDWVYKKYNVEELKIKKT